MAKKITLKDGIGHDPSELESAREYNKKLQDLGRSLLAGLYMLVRNVKIARELGLLDLSDDVSELRNFYTSQRPTWASRR